MIIIIDIRLHLLSVNNFHLFLCRRLVFPRPCLIHSVGALKKMLDLLLPDLFGFWENINDTTAVVFETAIPVLDIVLSVSPTLPVLEGLLILVRSIPSYLDVDRLSSTFTISRYYQMNFPPRKCRRVSIDKLMKKWMLRFIFHCSAFIRIRW